MPSNSRIKVLARDGWMVRDEVRDTVALREQLQGTAKRSASCRPRPMVCAARSRGGTGIPVSRAAAQMQSTMALAESMIVPSQSNTSSW